MEPCLNGTLVQADRTNKEVGSVAGQVHQGSWHGLLSLTVVADANSVLLFRNSSNVLPLIMAIK